MPTVDVDVDSYAIDLDGISLGDIQQLGTTVFATVVTHALHWVTNGEDEDLAAPFQNYLP
jgi:hypothetical protein